MSTMFCVSVNVNRPKDSFNMLKKQEMMMDRKVGVLYHSHVSTMFTEVHCTLPRNTQLKMGMVHKFELTCKDGVV